ncbi:hypothetical protein ABHF33_08875 [Chitinibacter sp. FCG-7]|uniref:Sel1 repeat family protein n=1 Tax=Chitinibacter mangrovi TaxID=3153927 RepID=A0AAU7F5L8_9NEIS
MLILSCKDYNDALNSLAKAYSASIDAIKSAQNTWIKDEAIKQPSQTPNLLMHIYAELGGKDYHFDLAKYYHRAACFNKTTFIENGLLSARDGAVLFLAQLSRFIIKDDTKKIKTLALQKLIHRLSSEPESGGPHAFTSYDEAHFASKSGLNYSIPEFFQDFIYENQDKFSYDFEKIISDNFKQCIVEFSATPECKETYIRDLWRYCILVNTKGYKPDNYHLSGHKGKGTPINPDQILDIYFI